MENPEYEKVIVDEVAGSARRIVIRLDIGSFTVSGPAENIITVESFVAFSTVLNEMYKEGYAMVPPEEYAATYAMTVEEVQEKIRGEGTLFLLQYDGNEAVPLEEKEVTDHLGPHLV